MDGELEEEGRGGGGGGGGGGRGGWSCSKHLLSGGLTPDINWMVYLRH